MSLRPAAVLIPLRRRETLEVYLVQRAPELAFLGGFHAFPGGSVDAADVTVAERGLAASRHESAAQRELFEELGVLVGPLASEVRSEERAELRKQTLDDANHWLVRVERAGGLEPGVLRPMGRWITPPFSSRLFDARYFAAWLDEEPDIWPGEHSGGLWTSAHEAISAHERGELFLSYPVLETLVVMAECGDDLDQASMLLEARGRKQKPSVDGGGEMLAGVRVKPVRTPTLPPATHTNTYVLGRGELVIVDPATPFPDEQDPLVEYVQRLESQGECLREIWLTHHHPDHVGAVERIRREFDVPVAAHPLTQEALRGDIQVDRLIEDNELTVFESTGGTVDRWRALHTPGHARGHLCFYEERLGTLLTGDLVVSNGTVIVAAPDGDMTEYFDSLARIRSLPKHGFLFPAHGPPVATAVRKIDEYIAHRTAREQAIEAALEAPKSAEDIVPVVYSDVPRAAWPLALGNVESHLVRLKQAGRVRLQGELWERVDRLRRG